MLAYPSSAHMPRGSVRSKLRGHRPQESCHLTGDNRQLIHGHSLHRDQVRERRRVGRPGAQRRIDRPRAASLTIICIGLQGEGLLIGQTIKPRAARQGLPP